ncbi:MAG: serine/threonine-protein kinase, partial [Planctomycetota bacterium]
MTDDESDPFDASTVDRQTFGELSAGAMVRINDLCDEFERELSESGQVDLQSFIAKLNLDESQESQVLIRELIAVDIHHRTKSGDTPSLADYRSVDPSIREDDFDLMLEDEWPLTSSDPQVGSLQPNQRIGDYLVLEEIGRGGMGHVYRAVHVLMNRMVAIKILTTKVRHDPLARERFKREITSVAKLDHRNIVTAFDARVEQDSLYLVTEWIDGSDMVRLVQKEGPLPPHQVIGIAKQAARGLRYAHDQGLIHRDIKPGNLLLDQEGVVKVLDLGLARMLDEMEDEEASPDALTKSTQIIGTPAFMAPEQARNPLDVDIRSDIYSFGCTLFFLLTGKLPYPGKNRVDSILAHTESETPVLSEVDSEIPEPMSHLVHDLMQKERSLRPATMDTVLDRLIAMEPRGDTIAQSTTATIERERMAAALARDSNVLKDGSNGKRFGLERILLAFALIGVLVGLSFVIFQPDDVSSGDSEQSNTSSVGTWFNGESSYAYSNAFDEPFDEPAMIEVLVTPQAGPSPSNVASWTG